MKRLVFLLFLLQSVVFSQVKKITLEDIWVSRTFIPKAIDDIKSFNDGENYSILKNNSIIQCSYKNGKEIKTIFKGKDWNINIESYTFSKNENLILISTNTVPLYRHSSVADYYVYNLKEKRLHFISKNGKQRLAEISPDEKFVAFVRDNNMFIFDLATQQEIQITSDGKINEIIYGAPDWVYEEEFSFSKGFFWSPDAKKIAFYRFDESNVKQYTLTYNNETNYPEIFTYKYPKAGEDNSKVDVLIYDLEKKSIVKANLGDNYDQYIPRIKWTTNSNFLCVYRLNRLQNNLELLFVEASTGKSNVVYSETNKYYIDINDDLRFLSDNTNFIFTSERDGYNHIYIYNYKTQELKQVTKGKYDVVSIDFIDEKNKLIYYSSTEKGPINKMLYLIKFDGSNKTILFNKEGTYNASFSAKGQYIVVNFSDANTPPQYIVYNNKLKPLFVLEDNAALIKTISDYNFVSREFFSFKTSEGVELNAWMMKPKNMEANRKYPVLIYTYGGPGSQTVKNTWGYNDFAWYQMLVQEGFIVVSVDNRGTGGRGEEFKKCTYLNLGKYESDDLIETAKYLATLPYVDKNRIGVFGWSYGGYMASLAITKGADYFNFAIAVAPVTNWRYYDNIYTERYMRKPSDNPDGYDKNSPIYFANKLNGKFLLIHGDADDNVHVQNTLELAKALIKANKQFEMFIYPNRNHGIYGGNTRYHLYTMMTNFLLKSVRQ